MNQDEQIVGSEEPAHPQQRGSDRGSRPERSPDRWGHEPSEHDGARGAGEISPARRLELQGCTAPCVMHPRTQPDHQQDEQSREGFDESLGRHGRAGATGGLGGAGRNVRRRVRCDNSAGPVLCNAEYLTVQRAAPTIRCRSQGEAMRTLRSDNTVALDRHALSTLNYIRASIEGAGAFAVPGIAGIAMGAVGVAAAVLASLPGLAPHWLEIWIGAAVTAAGFGVLLLARQRTRGFALYRGPARKFLLSLCPALLAGAVLTAVLLQSGQLALVPGVWLLLYGCAVLSASMMTTAAMVRPVVTMGAAFVLLGLLAFELPPGWHNVVLGFGFGALHLIFGALIGWAERVR